VVIQDYVGSLLEKKEMPRINKAFIETTKEPGMYGDDDLRGFYLRVRGKTKVFIARAKLRGTRESVLVTIGPYPTFSAEQARSQARFHLNQLALGVNPNQERKDRVAKEEQTRDEADEESKIREITLSKVFADYLNSRKLKDNTAYIYKCVLRSTLSDWLDTPLIDIKKDMVERRHKSITDKGHAGHADHTMRILRALFTYAMITYEHPNGEPIFTHNPVKRLSQARIWNKPTRRQTVIKSHELSAWCKAVMGLSNKTARDYLLLLLFTGLRKGEAAELLWENVDLKGCTILIPDPKNREPHMLPLTDFLQRLLKDRWTARENEYVFPGAGEKYRYIRDVRHHMDLVTESSGVKFMLHDLRRTFLTIADAQDLSAYAIKKLANHKMATDVTAGYIVSDVERLRDPMNRIHKFIEDKVGPGILEPSIKRPKVIKVEARKKARN
jgi:integrase